MSALVSSSAKSIPVISWAMYEELEDNALFYKFDAKKDDRLFSSIVIPKLDNLENFTPSLVLIGPSTFLDLVDELKVMDVDKNFDYPIPDGYDAYVFDYNGPIPSKEFYEPFGQVTLFLLQFPKLCQTFFIIRKRERCYGTTTRFKGRSSFPNGSDILR